MYRVAYTRAVTESSLAGKGGSARMSGGLADIEGAVPRSQAAVAARGAAAAPAAANG
jgi:hypothetical protein